MPGNKQGDRQSMPPQSYFHAWEQARRPAINATSKLLPCLGTSKETGNQCHLKLLPCLGTSKETGNQCHLKATSMPGNKQGDRQSMPPQSYFHAWEQARRPATPYLPHAHALSGFRQSVLSVCCLFSKHHSNG